MSLDNEEKLGECTKVTPLVDLYHCSYYSISAILYSLSQEAGYLLFMLRKPAIVYSIHAIAILGPGKHAILLFTLFFFMVCLRTPVASFRKHGYNYLL